MHRLCTIALFANIVLNASAPAAEDPANGGFEPPPSVTIPAGTFTQGDLNTGREVAWDVDADADGAGDGDGSWRSGRIGAEQHVDLNWSGETGSQISFWFRTDVDGYQHSVDTYNALRFLVDGTVVAAWTGDTEWTQYTYTIQPGDHDLTWRYDKKQTYYASNDSVWVDGITIDDGVALDAASLAAPSVISTGLSSATDGERPPRSVTLTRSYQMSTYEISTAQYVAMLNWALDPDGDGNPSDALIWLHERNGSIIAAYTLGEWGVKKALIFVDTPTYDSQVTWEDGSFGIKDVPGHPDGAIDSRADHPIVDIQWYGAMFYCYALNELAGIDNPIDLDDWSVDMTKDGWRLPTEAEWERAGRGGGEPLYAMGDDFDGSQVNWGGYDTGFEDSPLTVQVDSFAPNAYGLYNMTGNAREWCLDWFSREAYGTGQAVTDPVILTPGDLINRAIRGGGRTASYVDLRLANRDFFKPRSSAIDLGFRPILVGFADEPVERRVRITLDPHPADILIEHRSTPFLEGSAVDGGRLFGPLDAVLSHEFGFAPMAGG